MSQPKVFEFAKELGIETLILMDKIRQWNLPVKSHMASLDEELLEDIKNRLAAEAAPAGKKKVTKKKVAAKTKSADDGGAEKKTTKKVAKKAGAKKVAVKKVTKTTAEAADEAKPTTKKTKKKKTVIRRKSSQTTAEAMAEADPAAFGSAVETSMAQPLEEAQVDSENLDIVAAESDSAPTEVTEAPRVARPRGKIIGKMDLARVTPPQGQRDSGGQQAGAANRPQRPTTGHRNIRTGFVAAPDFTTPPPSFEDERGRGKDDKLGKKKTPGAGGGGREEAPQRFTATEFRKREVIFQPKKKKAITGPMNKKNLITMPAAHKRVVKMYETIKVNDLAQQMGIRAPQIIKKLIADGVMANINTDLDFDTVSLIVPEFGFEAQTLHRSEDQLIQVAAFGDFDAEKIIRPPVVTVMGHVDHGKTTLLDAIRKADVVKGEAGGITQHIGAYRVSLEDGRVATFIDTPGHEAFTAMRARGANVTDIAVIVVAADDGVMPQTAEAINHAKAANVPIIVAVNKMDKQGANPDRIKQQLTEFELVPEEWGGTTIFCPVSALKGDGIKELLEQIHLVAEVGELAANPKRSATGIVIEARMEKGRGNVATVLIKDGTVEVGQEFVAGLVVGRVRNMANDQGKTVKTAGPGEPIEIIGLPETPLAGDRFDICKDESSAQAVAQFRAEIKAAEESASGKVSMEDLLNKINSGAIIELPIVLKADVSGSIEAIRGMLSKVDTSEVKVKIIHTGVGGISESDVLLAATAKGLVIGFNVRPDGGAQRMAKEKGVEIKGYNIIYNLVDDMKKALGGLLKPDIVEKSIGRAEVRETFTVPKIGTIAGCSVVDGKIQRQSMLRLVRDGVMVYEGKLSNLKRFKDDVKEVATGFECGISIENFNDIKVGDVIEAFTTEEVAREL